MQTAKRRITEAVVGAVTIAAVNSLPPLAVEAFGHTLVGLGGGLKKAGEAVERAGERTLEYAEDQRDRNDWIINPDGPSSITVGGVRYLKAGS